MASLATGYVMIGSLVGPAIIAIDHGVNYGLSCFIGVVSALITSYAFSKVKG